MRHVTFEQYREGCILRLGGRLYRVGWLEPIRLQDGDYLVEEPREITNAYVQIEHNRTT